MNANIRTQPNITWDSMLNADPKQGDMSQTTLYSDWMFSEEQKSAHTLAWDGDGVPVGAFSVQLSMDGVNVDHTLVASDFSPALTAPAGTASRFAFEVKSVLPYRRIKYARTSGTGTLTGLSRTKRD